MKRPFFRHLPPLGPWMLTAGIVLFAVAYMTGMPIIKNALLLIGLACVIAGIILYIHTWKKQ